MRSQGSGQMSLPDNCKEGKRDYLPSIKRLEGENVGRAINGKATERKIEATHQVAAQQLIKV